MDEVTAKPRIVTSKPAIGTNASYAQSPVIRAKVTSLTFARNTVARERVVYPRDRRKISDAVLFRQAARIRAHSNDVRCDMIRT
jgi:hypothetical protein